MDFRLDRAADVNVGAESEMQSPHDILVFALDAAHDRLGVDANRRLGRAHIGILIAIDLEIIAQNARFCAALNLNDAAPLNGELNWGQQSAEVMHGEVDNKLA